MVRCSKCKKCFKQHSGKSWNDNMCNKCWNKNRELKYNIPKPVTRTFHTPIDFYLDQYTAREIASIDN